LRFVDGDFCELATFKEDTRIVKNVVVGTNEDDVVDVCVCCFAPSLRKVEEEESRSLSDVAALTLTHAETICCKIAILLSKAQVLIDSILVFELIVVSREVERSEMSSFVDETSDVVFVRKLDANES